MKNKRIKELERELKHEQKQVMLFMIVSILIFFSLLYGMSKNVELKEKLQSCQEKVLSWDLNVVCFEGEKEEFYFQRYGLSYEEYNNWEDELIEDCEVLK